MHTHLTPTPLPSIELPPTASRRLERQRKAGTVHPNETKPKHAGHIRFLTIHAKIFSKLWWKMSKCNIIWTYKIQPALYY
jgi:hypothetical protein